MSIRTEKCPACKGSGIIKVTDWLTKGMTEEELARKKKEALVDIIEVVRCRDCKWFREATWDGVFFGGCDRSSGMDDVTPDSFCSYGRRKTEE